MGQMGRPIEYTADIWPGILDKISSGASLSGALREPGMPSYVHAWRMLQADDKLKEAYQKAVEQRADRLAEEIVELADSELPAGLEGPAASAWVQQKRLQVDARKWVASKLKPRTYGDRLDVSVSDNRISVIQALEQAQARVQIGMAKSDDVTDVEPK
jgi:molybdenum-dependent DNA-binding transcriptional regulator ModE